MRRIHVFFYGLFMDEELLRTRGVEPHDVQHAVVRGYALRIGERATLVEDARGAAHGMLMKLTHAEIDKLYEEPSVRMYRPEAVVAELGGESVAALCFNLIESPSPEERNDAYAEKLRALAARLELPADYIDAIGR